MPVLDGDPTMIAPTLNPDNPHAAAAWTARQEMDTATLVFQTCPDAGALGEMIHRAVAYQRAWTEAVTWARQNPR